MYISVTEFYGTICIYFIIYGYTYIAIALTSVVQLRRDFGK